MKSLFKTTAAAMALAGAAYFLSAPAQADGFSISIGVPGVGFSYGSGGYCDRWGCPEDYWGYPVYYGPVYYDGMWFRGPVYYRMIDGDYWYWVHGGWHRDEWEGPRPRWWGHYRYGPALGYSYYERHGFRHDHDRWWHGEGWRDGDHRDGGWHGEGWRDGDHRDGGWQGGDHHDNGWHGDNRGGDGHGGDRHGGDHRNAGWQDGNNRGGDQRGGDHGDRGHGGDHHGGDHHDGHDHR